jgi:hypothetical protein
VRSYFLVPLIITGKEVSASRTWFGFVVILMAGVFL